jgi:hypothetical protein
MFVAQDDEHSEESWEGINNDPDRGSGRTDISQNDLCATATAVDYYANAFPGFLAMLVILGYKHASASADED